MSSAASTIQSHTLFSIDGSLATITFNRPDKRNAWHPDQTSLIRNFLYSIEFVPEVRCVLVKANGKHFMAGGDMSVVLDSETIDDVRRAQLGEMPPLDFAHLVRVMQRLKKPIVASVQGAVAGAAIGFISACDLVIAADTAFFWAAHILHAGSNDGLVSYFLPRNVGMRKALEMALLAERIYAPEAKTLGMINFSVPEDKLNDETNKLVARLCDGPTVGYGLIKRLMYQSFDNAMEEQARLEAETYGLEAMRTADAQEGLRAFFEHRAPKFNGR